MCFILWMDPLFDHENAIGPKSVTDHEDDDDEED
jgi:hypothetical protein